MEETKRNLREAILAHIEGLLKDGEKIPQEGILSNSFRHFQRRFFLKLNGKTANHQSEGIIVRATRMGFAIHHQRGSHAQLKHPDGRRITVPIHSGKDIRRGTLRAIINDLDIRVDEFISTLKNK
jgi:predicted RNA binding protein YcfA (HicA-like mRNA interferase family)